MVVGGHQHRRSGAVDPFEQIHDVLAGLGVEVARRLVGQQHQRPVDERAGDGDTLLLTAGQLAGQAVGLAGQAHHLQHVGHHPVDHVGALADDLQREGDVLEHRLLLQQPEVLEHAADDLAQAGDVPAGELVDVELRHPDVARGRRVLGEQQPHERRLARAGRSDEEDELTLVDLERDVVERWPCRRLVLLAHMVEGDHHGTPV